MRRQIVTLSPADVAELAAELVSAAAEAAFVRVMVEDGLKISVSQRCWTLGYGEQQDAA